MAIVLVVLFVVLVIQNSAEVDLRLFFWNVQTSLFLLILLGGALCFAAGYIVGNLKEKDHQKGE